MTHGVTANERLTAAAGGVLLVLALAETFTVPMLPSLLLPHFFIGVLLAGPVALKTASTGWRFLRYYAGHPAYRRKGPPGRNLRILAPMLLAATMGLLGTGVALAATGPAPAMLIRIHLICFLAWLTALVIHVYAHLPRLLRLIADDWRRPTPYGRWSRLFAVAAAVAAGTIAAVKLAPTVEPWAARPDGGHARILLLYTLVAAIVIVAGLRRRRVNA
ncbi:hypothetical protein [Flindersiella endophytica]